jgi:hypothetical protein
LLRGFQEPLAKAIKPKESDMIIAGIAIDNWKKRIFKKTLDEKGYSYTEHRLTPYSTFLKVKTDDVTKLAKLIKEMNQAAANSKLN